MFWLGVILGLVGLVLLIKLKAMGVKISGALVMLVGAIMAINAVFSGGTIEDTMTKIQRALPINIAEEIEDSKIKDGSIVLYVAGDLAGDATTASAASNPDKLAYNEGVANIIAEKTGRAVTIVPIEWINGQEGTDIEVYKNRDGEAVSLDVSLVPADAKVFVFLSPKLSHFAEDVTASSVWKERIAGGRGAVVLVGQSFVLWDKNSQNKVKSSMICSIDMRPDAYKFMLNSSMSTGEIFEKQFSVEDGEKD